MKNVSLLALALALAALAPMAGCKSGKAEARQTADTVAAPSALDVDSIVFNQTVDSSLQCKIVVDYPTGNDSLSLAVRNYVARELGNSYLPNVNGSGAKKYATYANGKVLVDYYGKGTLDYLKNQMAELRGAGASGVPGMSAEIDIRKTADNDRYVTFESTSYSFLGGAHGSSTNHSVNIAKTTGRVVECTVDTLRVKDMQPILRKGVLSYLRSQGDKEINDNNIADYLFIDNGIIPLPSTTPFLAGDGLHFVYQQYEIGPYAMGMVTFVVPYAEAGQFMTAEAKRLAGIK